MAIQKIPNTLIADNAVTAAKIANGTLTADDIAANSITGAKISATTSLNLAGLNTTGNVGIGTTSFTSNSVIKELVVKATATNGVASYTLTTSDNALGGGMRLTSFNDTNALVFGMQTSYNETDTSPPTERMRIDSSGNVGIGTSSPLAELNVDGRIVIDDGARANPTGGPSVVIDYQTISDVQGRIRSRDWDGATWKNFTIEADDIILSPAGNVGIGTSSPDALFEIERAGSHNSSDSMARITGQTYPSLEFYSRDSNSSNRNWKLSSVYSSYGTFEFLRSSAANGVPSITTLAMTNAGNVGIGTSSPDTTLHIHKGSAGSVTALSDSTLVLENSTHNYLTFLSPVDKEQAIIFGDAQNNNSAGVSYNHNTDNLSISSVDDIVFNTSGSTRGRFTDNGLCFNADTAAGNALNDYEEGTWSPSLGNSANINSLNLTEAGRYVKVGNLVHVEFDVTGSFVNAAVESRFSFSLPFNTATTSSRATGMFSHLLTSFSNGRFNNGQVFQGTTQNSSLFVYISTNQLSGIGSFNGRATVTYVAS